MSIEGCHDISLELLDAINWRWRLALLKCSPSFKSILFPQIPHSLHIPKNWLLEDLFQNIGSALKDSWIFKYSVHIPNFRNESNQKWTQSPKCVKPRKKKKKLKSSFINLQHLIKPHTTLGWFLPSAINKCSFFIYPNFMFIAKTRIFFLLLIIWIKIHHHPFSSSSSSYPALSVQASQLITTNCLPSISLPDRSL